MQRLKSLYLKLITPKLIEKFDYKTDNQVPKMKKIIINRGINNSIQNNKIINSLSEEINLIACQKPILTKAKKAISSFKVKENMTVGMYVTLRGNKMYSFFDRLVNLAFPRIRDFQGFNRSGFDGRGNYTLGLNEQLIFPEIDFDKISKVEGMTISIITTANNDDEAFFLLKEMGIPFNE
uniref:Large ribosomal subunit protein uL5c n=1 Tax=Trachelomonas volvocina TaxID=103340 RepID=A0A0G3VR21_9EUGL|nr:ribosomal protein L5 [Trachelomonas volvocina]AKL82430.1 ribosomal protein L5 [Trachelomonas volvocina]